MHLIKKAVCVSMAIIMSAMIFLTSGCKKKENDNKETTAENHGGQDDGKTEEEVYNLAINTSTEGLDGSYDISELLYGLFLEDINFAVDGGMYAELIKNRSFEYGRLATNGNKHGWSTVGDNVTFTVEDGKADNSCLNDNNPNYAVMVNTSDDYAGIANTGFLSGMAVEEGKEYKFSVYLKALEGYSGDVTVTLENASGKIFAGETISGLKNEWWKHEAVLTPNESASSGVRLCVKIKKGKVAADMVSLFPSDTYNNRENGLRKDIVEYLKALNPKFLRFPGGCVIEGKSLETAYDWKDSIGNGMTFKINGVDTVGDVAVRPLGIDIWADLNNAHSNPYYVTYGVGFYEYFLLCEDLECLPVPILNAGMSCPIQSPEYQVLATDSEEFKQYVQDALDLVEFCRGGADTKWGAVRIAMGHEEPFELKYIGIGNEQWQTEYYVHFEIFRDAFEKAAAENSDMYGDIELIVANGPASGDRYGWNRINDSKLADGYAGLVDEHYYQSPDWFLRNVHRYDSYDRSSVPVFLGEYAARSNNWQAALAEAAYLTGIEKNADIVKMACYAPLFANTTANQWEPDMIWFSNNKVYGSVNYYVQQLYACNVGTKMLKADMTVTGGNETVLQGAVGVGTWSTAAEFDNLKVVSNSTKEVLYEQTFEEGEKDYNVNAGNFSVSGGVLKQTNQGATQNETTGDTAIFGDSKWTDYTFTVDAKKTAGAEGFLIPIAVKDKDNFIFWNIGGWGNSVSCLQIVADGMKSDKVDGTIYDDVIQTGKTYKLKVVVSGNNIKCYKDNIRVIDYTYSSEQSVYESVSTDENTGDIIIKLVNVKNKDKKINISLTGFEGMNSKADVIRLSGKNNVTVNTLSNPEAIKPETDTLEVSGNFEYTLPKYSVTVIRIHKSNQ